MRMLRVAIAALLLAVFFGAQVCQAAPIAWDKAPSMNSMKDGLKATLEKFGMVHSQTPYLAMSELNKQTYAGIVDQAKSDMKAAKEKRPSMMPMPDTKVMNMPTMGKPDPAPVVKVGDTTAKAPEKVSKLVIIFPL